MLPTRYEPWDFAFLGHYSVLQICLFPVVQAGSLRRAFLEKAGVREQTQDVIDSSWGQCLRAFLVEDSKERQCSLPPPRIKPWGLPTFYSGGEVAKSPGYEPGRQRSIMRPERNCRMDYSWLNSSSSSRTVTDTIAKACFNRLTIAKPHPPVLWNVSASMWELEPYFWALSFHITESFLCASVWWEEFVCNLRSSEVFVSNVDKIVVRQSDIIKSVRQDD